MVGGGAMGLATAWAAASRRADVVLVERFEEAHRRGASHGGERSCVGKGKGFAYLDRKETRASAFRGPARQAGGVTAGIIAIR